MGYKPYFKKSDLLFGLTDEIIMKLAAHLAPEICMPDEQIMIKGELGDRMWLVTKGTVFVVEALVADSHRMGRGSIVGACEMVDGGPRMNTVRAVTIVEMMLLESERFHDIMQYFPEVLSQIRE